MCKVLRLIWTKLLKFVFVTVRFCGPATTVDIPTATQPRIVIRTEEEALAETGFRMCSLALYPEQVALLQCQMNNAERMYLHGPAGTGKTVVLTLRGIQWLQNNEHIEIVSIWRDSIGISHLMQQQMEVVFRYQAASLPQDQLKTFNYDFSQHGEVNKAVMELMERAKHLDGRLHLIIDEVSREMHIQFTEFITKLSVAIPELSVWCASLHQYQDKPSGLRTVKLTVPMRCPPAVEKFISLSDYMGDTLDCPTPRQQLTDTGISRSVYSLASEAASKTFSVVSRVVVVNSMYSVRPSSAPTDGPNVILIERHTMKLGTGGHTLGYPENCGQCGRNIAAKLKTTCPTLFQPDTVKRDSQWRDIIILCDSPSDTCGMVEALRGESIPVKVLTSDASDEDKQDMALAKHDVVIMTDLATVSGLERKIVVGMEQTIVTVFLHYYGKIKQMPGPKLWTVMGLIILTLALLIQYSPSEAFRRQLVVRSIEACVMFAFIAFSAGFNRASGLTALKAGVWLACMYVTVIIILVTLFIGFLMLLVWWIADEASGLLAVTSVFGVLFTIVGAMSSASTGLIISGTWLSLFLGNSLSKLCSYFLRNNSEELLLLGIREVFTTLSGILGGTAGGAIAGKLIMKGNWQRGIRRGLVISSFFTIIFVLYDVTNNVASSQGSAPDSNLTADGVNSVSKTNVPVQTDTPAAAQTSSLFLRLLAFAMLGMLLSLHGGMFGRVMSDVYYHRLAGQFYRINLVMVFLVTLFVAMSVVILHKHLTALLQPAELYVCITVFWSITAVFGSTFGWAQHRQACYPLSAMSRCTGQLIWMEEPMIFLMWLMYADDPSLTSD